MNKKKETTKQRIIRKTCQITIPRIAKQIANEIPTIIQTFLDYALKK